LDFELRENKTSREDNNIPSGRKNYLTSTIVVSSSKKTKKQKRHGLMLTGANVLFSTPSRGVFSSNVL